ncbi:unnamed protein product [marine sediment metagenome]|uniref:Uncharacterized protein n=1 Tax=marine sediment metagenome TaxID=412755 RepID=X1GPD6_9ZZZZ
MTENKLSEKSELLTEYKCRICQRKFYIVVGTRTKWDIDFGCPYGCDDNGKEIRRVNIKEAK